MFDSGLEPEMYEFRVSISFDDVARRISSTPPCDDENTRFVCTFEKRPHRPAPAVPHLPAIADGAPAAPIGPHGEPGGHGDHGGAAALLLEAAEHDDGVDELGAQLEDVIDTVAAEQADKKERGEVKHLLDTGKVDPEELPDGEAEAGEEADRDMVLDAWLDDGGRDDEMQGWLDAFEEWLPKAQDMMRVLAWAEHASNMYPVGHRGELSLVLAGPKESAGPGEAADVMPTLVHWYEEGVARRGSRVNLDKFNRVVWPLPLNKPQ